MGPLMVRPERFMAATCSATVSTAVTSWPARARYPASVPPIAPVPQKSHRIAQPPLGGVPPRPSQECARLLDRDFPDGEKLFVGTLVHSAVVTVAEVGAQRFRVEHAHPVQLYHGPLRFRQLDAREPGPGKVLHPRAVRRDRIDRLHLGPGAWRVPPVVEQDPATGV